MRSLLIFGFAIGLFGYQAKSQIVIFDVEAISLDSTWKDGGTKGYVSLDFTSTKQANQIFYFNTRLSLAHQSEQDLIIFDGRSKFTIDGNRQIINTGSGTIRYLFDFKSSIWTPEAFSQFQWDAVRGMRDRYLIGANMRITAIHTKKQSLFAAVGLFGESETWTYSAVPSDQRPANHPDFEISEHFKFNWYLKYFQRIGKNTNVELALFYQSRLSHVLLQPRIVPRAYVNIKLTDKLRLYSGFNGMYDYAPVVPIDRFYYTWNNSLMYRF